MYFWPFINNIEFELHQRQFFCNAKESKVSFSWRLDMCYLKLLVYMVKFNYYIKFYNDVEENYDKLNVSLKVSNILKRNLKCILLLKWTLLIYLKNNHFINMFNYIFLESSCKHMWIKLWSWHYHLHMSPNQNMEAIFQTW
jgi:hypothetical protein